MQPPSLQIYEYESVSSTMTVAQELWRERSTTSEDFVVWAHAQTAGKGQHGKSWQSLRGNLFATFALRRLMECPLDPHYMTILSGLAVLKSLEQYIPAQALISLKWPNDILLNQKKVCGILTQIEDNTKVSAFFIGVGVNLKSHPDLTEYPACNLLEELGVCIPIKTLIQAIMKNLQDFVSLFYRSGFGTIKNQWLQHCFGLDQWVQVKTREDTTASYIFRGIDNHGLPLFENQEQVTQAFIPQRIFWHGYHQQQV